jgi:Cellulase (glycosyl hydrolase family 5)
MIRRSRRDILGLGLSVAASSLVRQSDAQAAPPGRLRIRRGVNTWPWFSLTREYPAPRTDYPWPPLQEQRPSPRRADLRRLRAAGFDFIRIPVDPGPFLAGPESARAKLDNMLYDAIGEAIAVDLSVIVNVQANDATHYWNSSHMVASLAAPAFPAYLSLIAGMAHGMRRFDAARVALEPVNEPPQTCTAPEWSEVQMALLKAARGAAPDLTLVATGACGSMIAGLAGLDPTPYRALAPLLYTFHFYEPYLFSHQGAPWMREPVYRSLNAVPWPASAGSLETTLAAVRARMAKDGETSASDKAAAYRETERVLTEYFAAQPDIGFVKQYFSKVRQWSEKNDVPMTEILLGEFGALRSDARYVAAGAADRARYIRDVRETAEDFGLPWAFWNLFDGMGIMDDSSRALDPAIVASLGLTMPAE